MKKLLIILACVFILVPLSSALGTAQTPRITPTPGVIQIANVTTVSSAVPSSTFDEEAKNRIDYVAKVFDIILKSVNILFLILTAGLALFTYMRAQKTILQPIKTEVFKEQVKIFTQIMAKYCGKSESQLRDIFGFEELLYVNVCKLLDDYAIHFFGIDVERDKRPYNNKSCPHAFVTREYAEKHLTLITMPEENDNIDNRDDMEKVDSVRIEALDGSDYDKWSEYEFGITSIPNATQDSLRMLEELMHSPFLTGDSLKLLEKINRVINANIHKIPNVRGCGQNLGLST